MRPGTVYAMRGSTHPTSLEVHGAEVIETGNSDPPTSITEEVKSDLSDTLL